MNEMTTSPPAEAMTTEMAMNMSQSGVRMGAP